MNDPASQRAEALIASLGIQSAHEIDVELIAMHHDVFVTYRALSGHEGHLLRSGQGGLIVVDEATRASSKWRFVIAHELGHFFLHGGEDQFHLCANAEAYVWYKSSGMEAQANRFASHLLMPDALFLEAMAQAEEDPVLEHLSSLAERFNTSLTSTALRFLEHTSRACALVYAQSGQIAWCATSASFVPRIRTRCRLRPTSYAHALQRGEHIPNIPLPNDMQAWSGTIRAAHLSLFEHSLRLRSGEGILSWLTHE